MSTQYNKLHMFQTRSAPRFQTKHYLQNSITINSVLFGAYSCWSTLIIFFIAWNNDLTMLGWSTVPILCCRYLLLRFSNYLPDELDVFETCHYFRKLLLWHGVYIVVYVLFITYIITNTLAYLDMARFLTSPIYQAEFHNSLKISPIDFIVSLLVFFIT